MQNQNNQKYKIPVDAPFEDFAQHLDQENNRRIFFSAKFGMGKTYFLQEFFRAKKEQYEVFFLRPINYQISSNEDIVELIKLDILVELLSKKDDLFQSMEDKKDTMGLIGEFIGNNKAFLTTSLLGCIGVLHKPMKNIQKVYNAFKEFEKQCSTKVDLDSTIDEFVKGVQGKNINETDIISVILSDAIKIVKSKKQSVLVVDDLDRMDPEHIFRILNIFSAHFDIDAQGNKFGFDKVILVGDKDNIERIFYHKYGEKTDFIGYFNKFYGESGIYYFDNNKEVVKTIDGTARMTQQFVSYKNKDFNYIEGGLTEVLLRMFDKKYINLRSLLRVNSDLLLRHFNDWDDQDRYWLRDLQRPKYIVVNFIDFLLFMMDDDLQKLDRFIGEVEDDFKNKENLFNLSDNKNVDFLLEIFESAMRNVSIRDNAENRNKNRMFEGVIGVYDSEARKNFYYVLHKVIQKYPEFKNENK